MPMQDGGWGTNADGSENDLYCKFDYQDGKFTEPDLTVDGMVEKSVKLMTTELNFEETQARQMSEEIIPKLKRWQQ